MRREYNEPQTYLNPLSREDERTLAERMFWKRLQLFDAIAGSQECISAVYESAIKERETRGINKIVFIEDPPKYAFTTKPTDKEENKKAKAFNLSTLFCLLETAKECPTTANRNALKDYFLLHPDKAIDLCDGIKSYEEGDVLSQYLRLHSKLVEHNRLLVKSIAKKPRKGLDFDEKIEAGENGLMTAVHRFNVWEGNKFSTYATWWIKQTLSRTSDKAKVVKIPSYAQQEQKYGRWLPKETSLDFCTEDNGLLSCLEDKNAENPFEETARMTLESDISRLLTRISEREADILRMRYGIGGRDPMTLDEIGEKINLSRERVRQIEAEAFRKLVRRSQKLALAV